MDVPANTYAGSPLWRHNASRRDGAAVAAAAASPAARWALYDNDLRLLTAVPPPTGGDGGGGGCVGLWGVAFLCAVRRRRGVCGCVQNRSGLK